jgi:hypothetical protein
MGFHEMKFEHDDWPALLELASDLDWIGAAKLIREQSGISLREAGHVIQNRLSSLFPESRAATSYAQRPAQQGRTFGSQANGGI